MIVRMKELNLFTTSSSVDNTVQKLGELGVVDIKEINQPTGDFLDRCINELDRTERVIQILQNNKIDKKDIDNNRQPYEINDPKRTVDRVLRTNEIRQSTQDVLNDLYHQLSWYKTWGEKLEINDFNYLKKKGVYIRLYLIDKTYVASLTKKHCIVVFPEKEGKVPIALVSQDESEKLSPKEIQLPQLSYNEVKRKIIRKERQLNEVDVYLQDQAQGISALEDYLVFLQDRLGTEQTLKGMGNIQGKLHYLKGYIPKNDVADFKSFAQQQNWGYSISKPEKPENVPVYIKNPKWISIINPVMKFIDIVPGYKEVDVSIYFLVAFALFFAMLVGDAGYGAVFLLLAIIFGKKLSDQMRVLIYVLSGSAIIWGVLSGTYFGSEQIAALPMLNQFIIPEIASFGVDNITFMMHLSFLIGAIHLTVAHSVRLIQFINSIKALSELGWILLVWGLFFVTEQLVLGTASPSYTHWLFIVGASLVMLFSVESKSLIKSMLISVGNLPLSLINGFSDIVSYVRLFAVGMATAAVAASFNNMILPDGIANMAFLDIIIAAVALLLGHGLNIALALMAVMVHGIRLNMLEFAGHLGVEFSGQAYKPFKLIASNREFEDIKTELSSTK